MKRIPPQQVVTDSQSSSPGESDGQWLGDMVRRAFTYGPVPRLAGTYPVGVRTLRMADATLETWYPASANTLESLQIYGRLWRGFGCRNAAIRGGQAWPMVVFSHGLRGDRYDLSWLAESLACAGYVVVAVDHTGSTAQDFDRHEAMKLWRRATALSWALSVLAEHPAFAGHVDLGRCAVAGHSAGGSSALVMVGARINASLYRQMVASGPPIEEGAWHDPRVRAVIALAPGTGGVFDAEGLAHVSAPVLMISGTRDGVTPDRQCAAHYAKHVPTVTWHSLPNVGHYTFKPQAIRYGYVRAPGICFDYPGVDRAEVHARVIAWTRDFLRQHLG